jgi:hypothetical protein
MKFKISRVSNHWGERKPCPGALLSGGDSVIGFEWEIEIDPKDLFQFVKDNGRIILEEDEIIIYDDWVE